MRTLFYGIPLSVFSLLQFDTQDAIFREGFSTRWKPQSEKTFIVSRESYKGKDVLRFKSNSKTKGILLNNFTYSYKVRKVNDKEFIIFCKNWQNYWDGSDVIEILIVK